MDHKYNNTVIKVVTKEQGPKVIQWWKDQGINTRGLIGSSSLETDDTYIYYGLIQNRFNGYPLFNIKVNITIKSFEDIKKNSIDNYSII